MWILRLLVSCENLVVAPRGKQQIGEGRVCCSCVIPQHIGDGVALQLNLRKANASLEETIQFWHFGHRDSIPDVRTNRGSSHFSNFHLLNLR